MEVLLDGPTEETLRAESGGQTGERDSAGGETDGGDKRGERRDKKDENATASVERWEEGLKDLEKATKLKEPQ